MATIDPSVISEATGAPISGVSKSWLSIESAMKKYGNDDRLPLIAVAATVRVECPGFVPISEYGGPKYFARYDGRADLGNTQPGDGNRFHGRGFIQITGRSNYKIYGDALGEDLVNHPELALDPLISAEILAKYFNDRGVAKAARASDWKRVRKLVNGGLNGFDEFIKSVNALLAVVK